MKTASTYERKTTNAKMIIFMFLILGAYSCITHSFQGFTSKGIERSLKLDAIRSSASADHGLQILTRGASGKFVQVDRQGTHNVN
jgi:hypothetical protein